MRILLVSDLHYTLRQLDWVLSVAGDYDLVVVAGDVLDIASGVEPDAQIVVALEYLSRLADRGAVVACSGNHDLTARNQFDERAANWLEAAGSSGVIVDGAHLATEDLLVTVCTWWDGPLTRDAIDAQLAADAALLGDRQWLWAYHGPPDASPTSWTGSRHYGDEALSAWIGQYHPDLVLCGHVHESPFKPGGSWFDQIGSTTVFNAGRQNGAVPTHIEVDTTSRTARWSSAEGVEELSLSGDG